MDGFATTPDEVRPNKLKLYDIVESIELGRGGRSEDGWLAAAGSLARPNVRLQRLRV
jgi:hypothetical protein